MEDNKSKLEISLENGVHSQLALFTGTWTGTTRTWFVKDVLADESPVNGTITAVLGGRFLLHQYTGSLQGKPLEGIAIIGYSFDEQKFQHAWADSFHMGTGILFSEGQAAPSKHAVTGSYGGASMPEPWGWKTEIDLTDNDELVITSYNISPDGDETKATETRYQRVK